MRNLLLILSMLFITLYSFSQVNPNSIKIDLGADKQSIKLPSENRKIEAILLENAFPNMTYVVVVNVSPRIAEPLKLSGVGASSSACTDLQAKFNSVSDYATSMEVKNTEKELKNKLQDLITTQNNTACNDDALKTKIATLLHKCNREIPLPSIVNMNENNDYTFTITRNGDVTFTIEYTGKSRGRVLINYGFLFSSRKLEPNRYFAKEIGSDSFKITKKAKADLIDLRFTPTIFFSYFMDKNLSKSWNNSLSLGLGVNTQSPVVSIGYNGMYNQLIGFSAGIVFYEQQKLDGQYTEGQILKENLTEDKLYEGSFFRPNLFFSLNIRLGENPFKSKDKKE